MNIMVNIQKNIDTINTELVKLGHRRDTLTKEVEFAESEIDRLKGCLEAYEELKSHGLIEMHPPHPDTPDVNTYEYNASYVHKSNEKLIDEEGYDKFIMQEKNEKHFHDFSDKSVSFAEQEEEKINDLSEYDKNSKDIGCKECGVGSSSEDDDDDDIQVIRKMVHEHKAFHPEIH